MHALLHCSAAVLRRHDLPKGECADTKPTASTLLEPAALAAAALVGARLLNMMAHALA